MFAKFKSTPFLNHLTNLSSTNSSFFSKGIARILSGMVTKNIFKFISQLNILFNIGLFVNYGQKGRISTPTLLGLWRVTSAHIIRFYIVLLYSLGKNLDGTHTFLDISQAFNGHLYKLKKFLPPPSYLLMKSYVFMEISKLLIRYSSKIFSPLQYWIIYQGLLVQVV